MVLCPYCSEENIPGADICEACGQPLDFLSKPQPRSPLESCLQKDRVSMLAPRTPVVVEPNTPVADVLDLLVAHSIGCVVVVDDGDVVGIFSERDALTRLGADAAALGERPISDFMTPSPECCEPDARIAFALHKMDIGGYRHMPVVTDGRLTGVISIRDILDYITANLLAASN